MKVAKPLKCTTPNKINIPRIFLCTIIYYYSALRQNLTIYIISFKYPSFQNLAFIIKKVSHLSFDLFFP